MFWSHMPESRRSHLKKLAALLVGATGVTACAPALGPRVGVSPTGPLGSGRRVRIGLVVGAAAVRIGSRGQVIAEEGGRPAIRLGSGDSVDVIAAGDGVSVSGGGVSGRFDSLEFRGVRGPVTVDGTSYRGTVRVTQRDGTVTVVNELGIEEYVAGVIGAEMGRRPAAERAALEAQAIASRTYAMANLGRFGALGFDLRAGAADQAYRGVQDESDIGRRAVVATEGLVMTLGGRPITAFFHSTCGFATATPEESFRNVQPQPYLASVSDAFGDGYYCERSPRFRWKVEWSGAELTKTLKTTVPRALGIDDYFVSNIRSVEVRSTGASGRATEIRVEVEQGEIPVFGPDIRAVFQDLDGRALGSTAVQLTTERADDRVTRLVVAGAGWGHGVGMCQWGAMGRARVGQDARAILDAYFPGTTVVRSD